MAARSDLDFARLRPHHGRRDHGFEELLRQILIAGPPAGCVRLEHKGPGADGGVEVLAHLATGDLIGYQSKYFIDAFGVDQIRQIRDSFRRALASYARMVRYVVALPRNLSGAPGRNSIRGKWDAFVAAAEAEAAALGRAVVVELWDESALVARLMPSDPVCAGLRLFFFDDLALTTTWFQDRFAASRAELQDRYLPDDHVDVAAQGLLDIAARSPRFGARVDAHRATYPVALKALRRLERTAQPQATAASWTAVRQAVQAARDIAFDIDLAATGPIDLSPLRAAVEAVGIGPEVRALVETVGKLDGDEAGKSETWRTFRRLAGDLEEAMDAIIHSFRNLDTPLLKKPRLLIVGEAGVGKSHSLAHLVDRQIASGGAAVLFLGQQFANGDPRGQMLIRLGMQGVAFDTFLGAMNAAAIASGRPGLLVIDALNEAEAPHLWSTSLAGLAADVARFPSLALVVSCRDIYEARCIPSGWDVTRHEHLGFEGDAAAAAKIYLDRHGIDRPAAPFLDPAFTNPLFLSTCVRRLVAEGRTAFPTGLDGITQLFDFWLDGVEASLIRRGYRRILPGDGRLRAALRRFADQLALERREDLPLPQARALLEADLAKFTPAGPEDELLFRLIDEGVLRREPGTSPDDETVAFTFHRFSDHFIAEAILRLCDTSAALATALRPDGDFHGLVTAEPWDPSGVLEALMVQVPEWFGMELPDLEPGFGNELRLSPSAWLNSLRWRRAGATTARTVKLFEGLQARRARYDNAHMSLLLQAATVPGHLLNADYLHRRLAVLPMPERDSRWAAPFHWALSEDAPAELLLDWALHARTDLADPERVRLAITMLTWFTLSPARPLRDRATKALTALFLRSPGQIAPAIDRFAEVDDAYVRERLFAAALGAVLHLHADKAAVAAAATAADRTVFARRPVERHAFVRRYARGIVEAAAARGWAPADMLARAQPPYASEPVTHWPSWDDLRPHDPDARDILWSTVGHLPTPDEWPPHLVGDFGRYVMRGVVDDFSAAARSTGPPLTFGELRAAFRASVEAAGGNVARLFGTARKAHGAYEEDRRQIPIADIRDYLLGRDPVAAARQKALVKAANRAMAAFRKALPPDLAAHPGADNPFGDYLDERVPAFSLARAQRWAAARAIELGWRKDLHAETERLIAHSHGREHAFERIGKKYQWIAFHELIGTLADHHWRLHWGKSPEVLDRLDAMKDVDIDPSYLEPSPGDRLRPGMPALGLPRQDVDWPADTDGAIAWCRSPDGHPEPSQVVEGRDAQGQRWWLIGDFVQDRSYMQKMQSERPVTTGQWAIDLVLLRGADVRKLYALLQGRRLNNIDLTDRRDYRERLFGEHLFARYPTPEAILNLRAGGVSYGRATLGFTPYRGDYDYSGVRSTGFQVPRPWLMKALLLRPAGPSRPWFVDAKGRPVVVDPTAIPEGTGRPMLNAELLEPALEAAGLIPAWLTWMEKDGGDGRGEHFHRDGRYVRETYAGLWWRENGIWQGSSWRVDEEQLNPHLDDAESE